VPVHYLLNFSRDRAAEAVNRGVEAARQWCDAEGIQRRPGQTYIPAGPVEKLAVRFTEKLNGFVSFGGAENTSITIHLDVSIEDLDEFLDLPEHRALLQGTIECDRLGGKLPIDRGSLQVFVDSGDPTQKQTRYEISFRDKSGGAVTLTAAKNLVNQSNAGHELSTATVTLSGGGAGIVRSSLLDDIEQMASVRVDAPSATARAHALARFGAFYFGRLWDVYARHLLPVAPF
jgi:hypothetical protein